jgi:hypothetical protein
MARSDNSNLRYLWDNGKTTASVSHLGIGKHTYLLSDGICNLSGSVQIGIDFNILIAPDTANTTGKGIAEVSVKSSNGNPNFEWRDANGKIIGDKSVIKNLSAGNYSVIVGDKKCSISREFSIKITGIEPDQKYTDIIIYPNPTTGLVTIEIPHINELRPKPDLIVTNNTGKEIVRRSNIQESRFNLNLDDYSHTSNLFIFNFIIRDKVIKSIKEIRINH